MKGVQFGLVRSGRTYSPCYFSQVLEVLNVVEGAEERNSKAPYSQLCDVML